MSTELDSFSSDPIADSVFAVPPDYTAAPFADLMKEVTAVKR